MVMPRASRYNRRVLRRSDVQQPEPPTDEQVAYEKSTKNFVTKKAGFGPFNDINFGALARFGKENIAKNVTELIKPNGGKYGIVRAKDRIGQSTSVLEEFGPNAVENIVRNRKVAWNDAKTLGYLYSKTGGPLFATDILDSVGGKALNAMIKQLAKRGRVGPNSPYRSLIQEQPKD